MEKKKNEGSVNRRNLLKGLAALPIVYGLPKINLSAKDHGYISDEAKASLQDLQGPLPKGKLGKYEISRLVMGCNPMGGWSHARDLSYVSTLSKNWHTPEKMKQTWAVGEKAGINLANLTAIMYKTFNEYKKETGSKLMNMCQCSIGQPNDRLAPLKQAVQDGSDFIYLQGENTDRLATANALDVLFQALEYTHSQGLLFGVGAHSIQTILTSIKLGVKPDFYYKTFHHDNYWSATPRENRVEYPLRGGGSAMVAAGNAPTVLAPITESIQSSSITPSAAVKAPDHNQWNDNMWVSSVIRPFLFSKISPFLFLVSKLWPQGQ